MRPAWSLLSAGCCCDSIRLPLSKARNRIMSDKPEIPGDHAFTADSLYGTVDQPAYAG